MSDEQRMSRLEAMMWNVESDPWLDPSGGSVTIYDRPLDVDRFRRSIARAVADVPRLRQLVAGGLGGLSMPRWVPDHEFDLNWHVRRIGAPGDGSLRGLLDYVTPWLQDSYDRTRPLWMYVIVDGMADGRGALLTKIHHSVGDGQSLMKLVLSYTEKERDGAPAPDIDLDAIIDAEPQVDVGFVSTARDAVEQGVKVPADLARRALNAVIRPRGLGEARSDAVDLLKTADEQRHPAGSELWRNRSRRRHAEALSLPFDQARAAAHALGGTINDFFLTGAIEAARRYHLELGVEPETFHVTFVVSTHTESDDSANAFSPVPVEVPAGPLSLAERFTSVSSLASAKRGEVHGGGPLASMAAVASMLPTPVVTGIARDQASHIDFATSNLLGFVGDSFVAGGKTLHSYPFGPVAGTAFNLTMISMAGSLDLGVNIDPAAVTEPELLAASLDAAYADLMAT